MRTRWVVAGAVVVAAVCAVVVTRWVASRTAASAPPDDPSDALTDDRPGDKAPSPFDPSLVHPERAGKAGAWLVNRSAATFRLDVPPAVPGEDDDLLAIHPSCAAAVAASHRGVKVLPSVNMVDSKAKQFDDGLCAALDIALHDGIRDAFDGEMAFVRRLRAAVADDDAAAPFLEAGLLIGGYEGPSKNVGKRDAWVDRVRGDELTWKPVGYAAWSPALTRAYRFRRFFQTELAGADLPVASAIATVLARSPSLRADYQRFLALSAGIHDPPACLTMEDLVASGSTDAADLGAVAKVRGDVRAVVALLPPVAVRETALFARLFPGGLAAGTSLMTELVRRVRSGEVDLTPRPGSGWLDHQVFALETLLLPERGEEHDKLILSKSYKKRMLEAFQALVTKRLDTHVYLFGAKSAEAIAPPPADLRPTLRVEPCPSYYLRTARAYSFLFNFLDATIGADTLGRMRALREVGDREWGLPDELKIMRDLFYGLVIISSEDLGMRPAFAKDEVPDPDTCRRMAIDWLAGAFDDADMHVDARVSVPVHGDERETRLWGTIGVRLARLEVDWGTRPRVKPTDGSGDWQEAARVVGTEYLIPVDEFAEFRLGPGRAMTREEFRAACDRGATRAEILDALGR